MRVIFVCLCALLAGCGSTSNLVKVRIANAGPGLQMFCLPLPLAQELGFYKEEGLQVDLQALPSVGKSLQALIGGSVDVAGVSYAQTLQVAVDGQRLRSFFIMTRRGSNTILVAPVATERIRRAEDMKGALLGVTSHGSSSHLFANYYLAAHGVQPGDVRTVGIGVGAPAMVAIESGQIDAAVVSGGEQFRLLRRHPKLRILIDSSTTEGMREVYGGDVFASGAVTARPEWLEKNPDTARRLARALERTHKWLAAHTPEEIRERLPEGFRSDDASMDIEIIRWGIGGLTADGRMPAGAPEAMRRYVAATIENVRNAKIDLAATWTNEYLSAGR